MTVAQGTPRVDARAFDFKKDEKHPWTNMVISSDGIYVTADFARELEREVAALSAQVVELQQHNYQLTGEKFSDRMHAALRYRAETAEAKVKFLTENCDCKEIV